MAKSLIELVNKSGDAMFIWQTESDAALFEAQADLAQFSDTYAAMQKLLAKVDALNVSALAKQKPHEYFGLPENAVQFVPKDRRVIVYADLVVPEFRDAERQFFTNVIPARIRAYPSADELVLRAKKYGECNEYRADKQHIVAGEKINHDYWSTIWAKRYGEYSQAREKATTRIREVITKLQDNPSFVINQGSYELFEYWTLEFEDIKKHRAIYERLKNTPSLILTKVVE